MPDRILTVTQVAAQLGCSRQNVYDLIKNGTLPTVFLRNRRGQVYGIAASALAAWQALRAQGGRACAERCVGDITLQEAARRMGRSESALYDRVYRGKLPAHTHGNRIVIQEADLRALYGATKGGSHATNR